ncbi:MAG TPA: ABC transporter substrate-binding protein [Acidimicrobiales bacterium]|nr:ABC transporter substrate-binding protein [Acidimicrobiales bacterium]
MARRTLATAAALAAGLAVAACGSSSTASSGASGSSGTSATTATGPGPAAGTVPAASPDAAAAAMVPAKLKSAGVVNVATDASYAPNEFRDASNQIVGMDVDLGNAIGQVLGVKFKFSDESFDAIIGSLGSRFDLGMSSFTDTKAREQQVTMVDYFSAGENIMTLAGKHTDLTSLAALCGHTVGVEKGTTELDDATTQAKSCKLTVSAFDDEGQVNQALASGRVDAAFADSPVNAYFAKQSNGQFAVVSPTFSTAPYGIAVPKGSDYTGFPQAIEAALTDLQKSGTYAAILGKWGIQSGAVTSFAINGATS